MSDLKKRVDGLSYQREYYLRNKAKIFAKRNQTRKEARKKRLAETPLCAACGNILVDKGRGKIATYCNEACSQKGRRRLAERIKELTEREVKSAEAIIQIRKHIRCIHTMSYTHKDNPVIKECQSGHLVINDHCKHIVEIFDTLGIEGE